MENEKKLKYFKIYTQRNCELECLSENFLKSFECVLFDIVRGNNVAVCEYFDYKCVESVKVRHLSGENSCDCLQRGLVSASLTNEFNHCDTYKEAIFTDVTKYYDWILQKVGSA